MNGIRPGVWNVCHIADSTHVSMMPVWMGTQRQKEFWVEIGEWFEVVDAIRKVRRANGAAAAASSTRQGQGQSQNQAQAQVQMRSGGLKLDVVDEERCESPMSGSGSGSGTAVEDDGGADSPSDSEYETMKPKRSPLRA